VNSHEYIPYDAALAIAAGLTVLSALSLLKAFVGRHLHRLAQPGRLSMLRYANQVVIATGLPFVIGDFIVVDDYMGTVKYVGMKTPDGSAKLPFRDVILKRLRARRDTVPVSQCANVAAAAGPVPGAASRSGMNAA
jgi:hypothetical protein